MSETIYVAWHHRGTSIPYHVFYEEDEADAWLRERFSEYEDFERLWVTESWIYGRLRYEAVGGMSSGDVQEVPLDDG